MWENFFPLNFLLMNEDTFHRWWLRHRPIWISSQRSWWEQCTSVRQWVQTLWPPGRLREEREREEEEWSDKEYKTDKGLLQSSHTSSHNEDKRKDIAPPSHVLTSHPGDSTEGGGSTDHGVQSRSHTGLVGRTEQLEEFTVSECTAEHGCKRVKWEQKLLLKTKGCFVPALKFSPRPLTHSLQERM